MGNAPKLQFVPVGSNDAQPFGMEARRRARALAEDAGLDSAEAIEEARSLLLASMRYAWDPAWLTALQAKPDGI